MNVQTDTIQDEVNILERRYMFSISERNKITLTKGDTATLTLTIEDDDGNIRVPEEGDVVTFYIDDLDFAIRAESTAEGYVFNFEPVDTSLLTDGTYFYRIVLEIGNEVYTIFQDEFIDLLGGVTE